MADISVFFNSENVGLFIHFYVFSDVAAFFALRRRGPVKSDERVRLLSLGEKPLKSGSNKKSET